MSLTLPSLYHWAPTGCRKSITRHGLKPTCPTAVWVRPDRAVARPRHVTVDLPDQTILTVCLGTSPSTAWSLSGRISATAGESWDLWEVDLDRDDDEVHFRPVWGAELDEVRVANRVPKSRCWLVGTRVVGSRRLGVA